jgi:hypothetical protein
MCACPSAFAGTTDEPNRFHKHVRPRGAMHPRLAENFRAMKSEGAGNAGCAPHPRSRVQNGFYKTHTSIQVQRRHPTFPAQWLYGLCRDLLGDEFVLSPSLPALKADRSGRIDFATDSLAPATGVRTTRFCRTQQRRSSARRPIAHGKNPPCDSLRTKRCRVHRIPSRVRDDRDTPLLPGETGN